MTTLTDYIDSIQVSISDIRNRISMQEDEFNESKYLTAAAKKADEQMGEFRDMFFERRPDE